MRPEDASALARYLMDHRGASKPDSWYSHVLHDRTDATSVILPAPVPMVISE